MVNVSSKSISRTTPLRRRRRIVGDDERWHVELDDRTVIGQEVALRASCWQRGAYSRERYLRAWTAVNAVSPFASSTIGMSADAANHSNIPLSRKSK
jgi:hypothetical protein